MDTSMKLLDVLILMGSVGLMIILAVFVGAYVTFKAARAVPGERFLGGVPKGQMFTLSEADEAQEFPDAEGKVLERTEQFLKTLAGGKG